MHYDFPVLLAYTFFGSFLLTLLQTRRWKILLVSIVVVWCIRLSPTGIGLLDGGKTESIIWFAFLSVAICLPTLAVSLIGTDLATRLMRLRFSEETEDVSPENEESSPE